jgi:hypothetical protein
VQYDITKHLKAQAMLGTGTTAAVTQGSPLEDNGSGVGLSYEFENIESAAASLKIER